MIKVKFELSKLPLLSLFWVSDYGFHNFFTIYLKNHIMHPISVNQHSSWNNVPTSVTLAVYSENAVEIPISDEKIGFISFNCHYKSYNYFNYYHNYYPTTRSKCYY